MITITSLLWMWKTQAAGRWYFLSVPDDQSDEIRAAAFEGPRGFGSVRVEAVIGDVIWRTSVFPQTSGGYILPVKADIRKRASLSVGDKVRLTIRIL